jgi:hypothetical protein
VCFCNATDIDNAKIEQFIKTIEKEINDIRVFNKDRSEQLKKFKEVLNDMDLSKKKQIQKYVEDNIKSDLCHFSIIDLLNEMGPETKTKIKSGVNVMKDSLLELDKQKNMPLEHDDVLWNIFFLINIDHLLMVHKMSRLSLVKSIEDFVSQIRSVNNNSFKKTKFYTSVLDYSKKIILCLKNDSIFPLIVKAFAHTLRNPQLIVEFLKNEQKVDQDLQEWTHLTSQMTNDLVLPFHSNNNHELKKSYEQWVNNLVKPTEVPNIEPNGPLKEMLSSSVMEGKVPHKKRKTSTING